MSSAPTASEIWKDARWLAQAVDPRAGLVRLVEMAPDDYTDLSFLDDRMFQSSRNSHLVRWDEVAAAVPRPARKDTRWIFHIGHVGSTLVSRLLGELRHVLAVREPRSLRDLTFFPRDVRDRFVPVLAALHSRTFAEREVALVKATSFVSEIAGEFVADSPGALFLFAGPRSYIAGILAGENSRVELAALSETRKTQLEGRGIRFPLPRTEADLAAAAWACGMTALEAASGPNVVWADFDHVLRDVAGSLLEIAGSLKLEADPDELSEITGGPLLTRYSKALEFDYSPKLRSDLLGEAMRRHGPDIEAALAMLSRTAETAPGLASALNRAQLES